MYVLQESKSISIKMMKDVGMTVPKVEKQVQYICSKTGDEGSIYAAKQGMRACNNNNMRNPINKRDVGRGCMPCYVSIKAYKSTVQEFCAAQLRLYGRVGAVPTWRV